MDEIWKERGWNSALKQVVREKETQTERSKIENKNKIEQNNSREEKMYKIYDSFSCSDTITFPGLVTNFQES